MSPLRWWPADLSGAALFSTLFHARYSLLTLAAPAAFACLALWVWPRGTLYSLLLPRMFRDHQPNRSRALVDLFWIAFASACLTAVAGAGVKMAAIHGPERTPSLAAYPHPRACLTSEESGGDASDAMIVWPLYPLLSALIVTLVLPGVSITIWRREQRADSRSVLDLVQGVGNVAAGIIAAATTVLVIGILRRSLFGPGDWILPLRPPRAWSLENLALAPSILGGLGEPLLRLGLRAGYLDPCQRLWAGQAELILCVLVAAAVYARSLIGIERGRRPEVRFCTAVYVLVCLGTAGVVLAGVAFWADGIGLAAPLIVAIEVVIFAWLARTDHFFELRPRGRAVGLHTHPATASPNELPWLEQCFRNRIAQIPLDADGRRTAIVVTASGGGIQAAAWTAEVMTGLAESFPAFTDSLCLVSGVSGGSVGAGCFVAGAYLDPEHGQKADGPSFLSVPSRERLDAIREHGRASLLEQVAWGVAFTDLPRLFTGFIPRNRLVDRGWAIEKLLEKRLVFGDRTTGDREPSPPTTLRDLCPAVAAGRMPVPLFNATCVQTGQRVIMSPVRFGSPVETGSRSRHIPEDYSNASFAADPTLATAIRLSATFSYASPVARPTREDEKAWKASATAAKPVRFDLHLCDGGYADNTGVVAAVEACRDLLAAITNHPPIQNTRILFIRIEPFPTPPPDRPDEETRSEAHDGFSQVILGPAYGLLSARMATQAERADRDLAQFTKEAGAKDIHAAQTIFRFGGNPAAVPPVENPPLSWSLSERQQEAIKRAWTAIDRTWNRQDPLYAFARNHGRTSETTA